MRRLPPCDWGSMTRPSDVRITGPVTGGAHGWAFGASVRDLDEHGYSESEYFLDGEADRYRLAGGDEHTFDGRWAAEVAGTQRVRTRVVVRRPDDPARANGTLIVSWNNVSNGYDAVVPLTARGARGRLHVGGGHRAEGRHRRVPVR